MWKRTGPRTKRDQMNQLLLEVGRLGYRKLHRVAELPLQMRSCRTRAVVDVVDA